MKLERLFYPKSVAVIGASPHVGGGKVRFFQVLQENGYKGALYPVNPKYKEIGGVKAYASPDDLPDAVDLTIVAAPVQQSLDIMRTAARKKFRFVHFFTSGFGEVGNGQLEEELLREARKGGVRIVGPNCMGAHCTESGVSFGRTAGGKSPGSIAFLGQSGGVTGNFMSMARTRKIDLNKVVSYGNQIDMRVEDFLDCFADDRNIRLIACYIEDIKDTRAFLKVLRRTTAQKPVIILKGGRTESGAKAAASHTGAMASDYTLWSSAVRQHGAILVDDFDGMMNMVMLGAEEKRPTGRRMGFVGAGGGVSVLFTDLASQEGLSLPELQPDTQQRILETIRGINTSTTNPVDLGAFGFDLNIMLHAMKAMDEDENIDVIVPYFSVEYIKKAEVMLNVKNDEQTFLRMSRAIRKPVIPILASFTEDDLELERTRISVFANLRKAGFPVYTRIHDAVCAVRRYLEWAEKQDMTTADCEPPIRMRATG